MNAVAIKAMEIRNPATVMATVIARKPATAAAVAQCIAIKITVHQAEAAWAPAASTGAAGVN